MSNTWQRDDRYCTVDVVSIKQKESVDGKYLLMYDV